MEEQTSPGNFENSVLPHLDAAYNLARWLTRNGQDAEDAVQEACLRAFRFFGGFRGGDARAWLLKIVRNTCYTQLQNNRPQELATTFDEEIHSEDDGSMNPEMLLLRSADSQLLTRALEELPVNFREVLVLRELEGLSYREIAEVSNIPPGTVMSSLSRARERLRQSLTSLLSQDAAREAASASTDEHQRTDSIN
ncbi:MAG TPA: sigma-70 family RNA polymerase sigma factor [Candidatus Acidoferrum sp.]|nr:sigma-70 family RNA polymerase sigma factor [Candidatus Acidoferrum sp.]